MMKYIYLLIGATFIAGGMEVFPSELTFYACGVIFVAAGFGEILIGE